MDLMQNPKKFKRTDMWREGEWIDLWSFVHFLSGISIGLGFYFLHVGDFASVALALVSLIAYEMWERLMRMEETSTNGFMDVVVGMLSFLLTFFVLAPLVSGTVVLYGFGFVFVVDIVMSVFGWRASQKAAEFQQRMLARYTTERARLLRQKTHLQKKFKLDH